MGTTDKKNRKEATGSVEKGSGNSSADASASLQARRAKLRGALGGRNTSFPDPFAVASDSQYNSQAQQDPYAYDNDASQDQDQSSQTVNSDPYANTDPGQSPFPAAGTVNQVDPYSAQEDYNSSAYDAYDSSSSYFAKYNNQTTESDPYADYSNETPVNVYGVPITAEAIDEATAELEAETNSEPPPRKGRSAKNTSSIQVFQAAPPLAGALSDKTTELVNSIDQSLNVCATNLAALQNLAGEQTDVLRSLSSTLQNQTLLEIGLNLNSLTESLTAALEPMKAIGELVPALDSLVTALESKEQEQTEKMSPDQLVTSLADQLSAGLIDPWTFKCAYMAVYPADPPAELLHRLVELLGSQRISGDLFRAAYEAVQAAEPPPRSSGYMSSGELGEAFKGLPDDLRDQIEGLERSNRDLQRRQEEREQELSQLLAQKDNELQSIQEQLNQRLEELNNRYSDAADMISSREEEFRAAIESKDMDLIEKDAELNMLRAQMDEFRTQTEEMVKDLQKELLAVKEAQQSMAPGPAAAPAQAGIDSAQASSADFFNGTPRPSSSGLFEPAPSKPVFASDPSSAGFDSPSENFGNSGFAPSGQGNFAGQSNSGGFQAPQAPSFQPPPQPNFQPPSPTPAPAPAAPAPPQPARPAAGPTPPTTPLASSASGSYGMGVRQQVFEVIVRQALAGAPWREICAGPMQVNNITPDEVESEVKRRQSLLNK